MEPLCLVSRFVWHADRCCTPGGRVEAPLGDAAIGRTDGGREGSRGRGGAEPEDATLDGAPVLTSAEAGGGWVWRRTFALTAACLEGRCVEEEGVDDDDGGRGTGGGGAAGRPPPPPAHAGIGRAAISPPA